MENRCIECDAPIMGRIDKKYCSDQCRSAYNNRLKTEDNKLIKKINNILKKNRQILVQLNPTGKTRVKNERMIDRGFNFNYFTSQYINKKGQAYHFCYDHGYLQFDDGWCLLVVRKEE